MKKSKLAVARGAMHDARHAENALRAKCRDAKKLANEFRREAMGHCAEKEAWIYERSKLIKQRDELLAALDCIAWTRPPTCRLTAKHAEEYEVIAARAIVSVKGGAA